MYDENGSIQRDDLCKEDGIPEPEFAERTGGLSITFKFKEPIGATAAVINKDDPPPSYEALNARQKLILEYIKTEVRKVSTQQICDYLSKLNEPAARKTIVRDLNYMK